MADDNVVQPLANPGIEIARKRFTNRCAELGINMADLPPYLPTFNGNVYLPHNGKLFPLYDVEHSAVLDSPSPTANKPE